MGGVLLYGFLRAPCVSGAEQKGLQGFKVPWSSRASMSHTRRSTFRSPRSLFPQATGKRHPGGLGLASSEMDTHVRRPGPQFRVPFPALAVMVMELKEVDPSGHV